jgi:hypothetical protein
MATEENVNFDGIVPITDGTFIAFVGRECISGAFDRRLPRNRHHKLANDCL